jgi:hypothetical protein
MSDEKGNLPALLDTLNKADRDLIEIRIDELADIGKRLPVEIDNVANYMEALKLRSAAFRTRANT